MRFENEGVGRRRPHEWRTPQSGALSVRYSVRIGKGSRAALDCGFAKRALPAFPVTGNFCTGGLFSNLRFKQKILNADIVSFPAA